VTPVRPANSPPPTRVSSAAEDRDAARCDRATGAREGRERATRARDGSDKRNTLDMLNSPAAEVVLAASSITRDAARRVLFGELQDQ